MQKRGFRSYFLEGTLYAGVFGASVLGFGLLIDKGIDHSLKEIGRGINCIIQREIRNRDFESAPVEEGLERKRDNNYDGEISQFMNYPGKRPWDNKWRRIFYVREC